MANESESRALQLEPSLDECRAYRDRAAEMLAQAWANPDDLGEDSAICKEATRLHWIIRGHCSPQEDAPEAREQFLEALHLSWHAVWRARDYSFQGVAKRLKAADRSSDMLENVSQHLQWLVFYGERRWFPLHFPLLDAAGLEIPLPHKLQTPRTYMSSQHPALYEGAIIRDRVTAEGIPDQLLLRWAWISPDALFQRGELWQFENSFCESAIPAPMNRGNMVPALHSSIFLPRVNLTHWPATDYRLLEAVRFEGGVEMRSERENFAAEFPASVETGPGLVLHGQSTGKVCVFDGCYGLRKLFCTGEFASGIELRNLRDGLAFHFDAKGISILKLVAADTRFREVSIRVGQIQELDISGECAGAFSFEGVQVVSASLKSFSVLGRANFTKSIWANRPTLQGFHIGKDGSAEFEHAEFSKGADFAGARFDGFANFKHARFDGPLTLDQAVFLAGCSFEAGTGNNKTFAEVTFFRAEFHVEADFDNRKFEDETRFVGARFYCAPSFHGATLHSNTDFSHAKFWWHQLMWPHRIGRGLLFRFGFWRQLNANVLNDNLRLDAIETRFRVLTALARRSDSPSLAFRFHREELKSRHMRTADPKVPRWDAVAGWFYGLWGDYGGSFARPLIWFFVAWLAFAAAYWSLSTLPGETLPAALHQSAAIQLRPFSNLDPAMGKAAAEAWRAGPAASACSQEIVPNVRVGEFCFALDLTMRRDAAFHMTAGLQSVVSLILLFLTALGLRRQFQLG